MTNKAPTFAEKTFIESGREITKERLTPEQLKAIVSQLSVEERPRFHKLFLSLAESTKPGKSTDTEQKPLELPPGLMVQLEKAESLFGNDFMGPLQFEKAFGFMPNPEQIPTIPFSPERLERAKQMGQMLVPACGQNS